MDETLRPWTARYYISLWVLLLAASGPTLAIPPLRSGVEGFMYADALTSCVDRLRRQFPYVFVDERSLTLLVAATEAHRVFADVRSLSINTKNESLNSVCGYCNTLAFS